MLLVLIAIPAILLWVVGTPLLIFVRLRNKQKKLGATNILIKYGLYYVGLRDEVFYWEIVVVNLRKFIIVVTSIVLSRTSKFYIAYITFLVLYCNV